MTTFQTSGSYTSGVAATLRCVTERRRRNPTPETLEERVYAATLALNAGAPDRAIEHLDVAAAKEPDSDHIHYMLAVARAAAGETKRAVTHLERAIELNPDNRFLARNEPSFETLQENAAVRRALSSPPRRRLAS